MLERAVELCIACNACSPETPSKAYKVNQARLETNACSSKAWGLYQDGQEEGKGKAVGAHSHISIVGPKEQGDENHNIEARQCPDALWRPACTHSSTTCLSDIMLPQV